MNYQAVDRAFYVLTAISFALATALVISLWFA
jgi:hypothetical protein